MFRTNVNNEGRLFTAKVINGKSMISLKRREISYRQPRPDRHGNPSWTRIKSA